MEPTKTTLNAHGIKCQGCATAAKAAVDKLPGVKNVEVDVPGKTVTVTHDQWTDRDALARALSTAGFPAS
jgi:copper chaperone CopZ